MFAPFFIAFSASTKMPASKATKYQIKDYLN
jgi:hypothetical protein